MNNLIYYKFLYKNDDITQKSLYTITSNIKQGKKKINNTEQRLIDLFLIQDTENFINHCLKLRTEIQKLI